MSFWEVPSGRTLNILQERQTIEIELPVSDSVLPLSNNQAELSVISGEIPKGLRLEGHYLLGTPYEVVRDTMYTFVLRLEQYGVKQDRTYNILVQGPDDPVWVTPEGSLPVGSNEVYFILDSAVIDFQLIAYDPDEVAGDNLEYYIVPGEGELPPGISLSTDGRLSGITEPILEIPKAEGSGNFDAHNFSTFPYDYGIQSDNGYDSFQFDTTKWDYNVPHQIPNKLNRHYQFVVTISDGDSIAKRKFDIYLVGDDFLRADNTIMRVANGVFTADNSYIRTPVWLTPADLGYRRANNYITLFLDVIDLNTLTGLITYELQPNNPDGTPSIIPPGLELDYFTGELAGRVPYQPAITKEYKFTLRALRRVHNDPETTFKDKTFSIRILGEIDSFIEWVTPSDLGTINSNFISNIRIDATTTLPNGIVRYAMISGKLPPGLRLTLEGDIIGKINSFGSLGAEGITVFDSSNFTLDNNTTTIDREFRFTARALDRAGYSAIEREFVIRVTDPDDKLYSSMFVKPFYKNHQRQLYRDLINDYTIFDPDFIYRPSDPAFGIQREMRMLLYAGIETKTVGHYVAALSKNNKRKRYKMGSIKNAVAKLPGTNTVVYEVVYVDVIDPAEYPNNPTRKSFDTPVKTPITVDQTMYDLDRDSVESPDPDGMFVVTRDGVKLYYKFNPFWYVLDRDGFRHIVNWEEFKEKMIAGEYLQDPAEPWRIRPVPENTFKADFDGMTVDGAGRRSKYISNIYHSRENIRDIGETEIEYLPLWMRSSQQNAIEALGYVKAVPLCYCKPGLSADILANLSRANIVFHNFDFEIDRVVIDTTEGVSQDQYLVFHNYSYNV